MPTTTDESNVYTTLRDKAETLLHTGNAPKAGHWSMGVDALQLLHRLSSDPDKAQDALKLLHELQVHQVELDLQNETIAADEQALMDDLGRYRALYDGAPMAYCIVDHDGVFVQGNRAAAELFDVAPNDLEGRQIETYITPNHRPLLRGLLQRVAESGARDACVAESNTGARRLQFLASATAGCEHILLACCPCADAE